MAEENDQSGNNNSDTILPSESNVCNENASPEPKSFMEELVSKIDNEIANGDYIAVEEIEEEDPFETMVAEGLSQLGRSADGTMQVFLSLSLRENGLQSIEGISSYNHLQILDVSHNELEDLTTLSNLPNLISLDASHNKLSTVLEFQPPLSLREVNLSNNKIETLTDLSQHKNLNKLILDYNTITEITGLEHCKRLKILSISNNVIEKLSGLDNLPLKYLDLSMNKLKRIENIGSLKHLQLLDLSYNAIRSLRGLQSHDLLDTIRLRNNEIIDLSEVRYIRDLPLLRVLDLSYNPIQDFPDYRLSIVFRIPRLVELDNIPVQPEEKVASENLFKPRLDIIAARNHMMNLVRSYLQPIKLYNSTLSSTETPYPMLVLTGPSGCGKRTLIKKLCQEFPNFFGEGVSYTTRGLRENEKVPRESEVDGTDYHFTTKDDFERDTVAGKFISTSHLYNSQYGISRDAIEAVAKEGLACALHLELEGVMVLKNTHFEPRYILILPETKQAQEERMRSKKFYSDSHINQAIERVALYVETNREHPGYFDTVICSDDLEESYKQLKRVVLEYLGISPVNSSVSCISRSTHESEISPVSLSEVTRPISTPYDKESLTASAVKPWIRTSAGSRALESNNHTNLPRSAKSPVVSTLSCYFH
ncbi:leucine-rich repeat and guanylate kinase domain-containing protein-like isoform X2 [Rhopilema esculentum]|uniref:leucine-rich repeat and guanylate kinase domain-containing protein-like isoform X2 n=1 Tax=Rhopilema esculentum TaxID=499914 RepID=UPI0031E3D353